MTHGDGSGPRDRPEPATGDATTEPDPRLGSDRSGGERPNADPEIVLCDLCGAPMVELHCKLECHRCGYKRDCSDP